MSILIELYMRLYRGWMSFPEKMRYLFVGGYNTVVSYALYAGILWLFGGKRAQLALFLSFLISSLNSFLTQKWFVFGSRGRYLMEYVKCLLAWGISYLFNALILALLIQIFKVDPYVAQIVALVLVTVNSYLMLKYVAFRADGLKQLFAGCYHKKGKNI